MIVSVAVVRVVAPITIHYFQLFSVVRQSAVRYYCDTARKSYFRPFQLICFCFDCFANSVLRIRSGKCASSRSLSDVVACCHLVVFFTFSRTSEHNEINKIKQNRCVSNMWLKHMFNLSVSLSRCGAMFGVWKKQLQNENTSFMNKNIVFVRDASRRISRTQKKNIESSILSMSAYSVGAYNWLNAGKACFLWTKIKNKDFPRVSNALK